ncbi:hypothetical protein BU25DRAFT_459288 [Macroventuria anomochaeta]|uniref:Uncharacterized protein n=1 Tax=Macroventuria anomochaeta TaxID=301207 RepID=A0ACB6RZK9_9PLEO|nr:uncharacterized protein BU25DRAFT_459288 [Macroventuria anomochaeta]KAF2626588.1 hypothetical protein BU25DRAFT_459288 [Macroventuria anomochaeta]
MPISNTWTKSSDEIRKLDNDVFTKRAFSKALTYHQQAAEHDPADYRAPWNTPAIYFEMGEYSLAVCYTGKALSLATDETTRQKIINRESKAHLHLQEVDKAKVAIEDLLDGDEKKH